MKDNEILKHLHNNVILMDNISAVLKEHNDMFGLLLQQHKDLLVSLKLLAHSLDNLQERMVSMEKFNCISKN